MQPCTTPKAPPTNGALMDRFYLPDHRVVWANIVPGLEDLLAQHPDNDWSVDSVRKSLDEDISILMVDVGDPSAFAVVRFGDYPYREGETEMFVHIIYHQGGNAFARWHPHFEMFARHGGARHMRFYSRRPAFIRIAQRIGYQTRALEYVKELNHG